MLLLLEQISSDTLKKKKDNFITKSISLLENNKLVYAFKDYYFTPIYITNLLEILKKLIRKKATGIINVVGNERVSKYDFLLKISNIFNLDFQIKPTLISKSKLTAKRHLELSLSNNLLKKKYNISVPNLNDQIKKFYKEKKIMFLIAFLTMVDILLTSKMKIQF